jgi:lipopolysaccharide transport protein LptA
MIRAVFLSLVLLVVPAISQAAKSVGVAPFERSGTGDPPPVATLLADRLVTAGVSCIGPDRLGVPAVAEPEPAQVQAWSEGIGVDAIVFGRITGIGTRFSVDLQLRSTETGEVVSVHVGEISRPGAVDAAVEELTRKVLEGLSAMEAGVPVAALATPAAVSARPSPSARKKDEGLFGGGSPLRITSNDLEARQSGGARHMIFTDNVKAVRTDITLTARRLDAFYPKGSSRPEKLVATGNVVLTRSDGEAHCDKMTYVQGSQRVHCEGHSELVRDGDRARGDKIEWDLETDTIYIKGNADVLLSDSDAGSGS